MADKLKTSPKVARELTGSGALPAPENLVNKTPFELVKTLRRFNIDPDIDAIDRRAKRAFMMLEDALADGKMPSAAQWERITQAHEKEMVGNLRKMVKSAIRLHEGAQRDSGPDDKEMWVTSEMDNVCADCEPLHGQIKTHAEWVHLGLPGTSRHVCKENCNCKLVKA